MRLEPGHTLSGPGLCGFPRIYAFRLFIRRSQKKSSRKLGLLHPAPHTRLVVQVLLPEGAFQITLLAPDHLTLDHEQRQR